MKTWPKISIDTNRDYSMCFGCGQNNPIGLKLDFQWDGKTARAEFVLTELYQGWPGFAHGGIISCLLDEAMGYAALFEGLHCVTAEIWLRLRRTVPIGETLILTSSLIKKNRRLAQTRASISLRDGTLMAEGTATQFIIRNSPDSGGKREEKP